MTVNVAIQSACSFDVPASYDEVFGLLADVPLSASHFPKVERLVDVGGNTFRWELEKTGGIGNYHVKTVYACKYTDDKEEGWVRWIPIEEEGNAVVQGAWRMKPLGSGTHIDFETSGELHLPLPRLVKAVAKTVARREYEGMIDVYIRNLKTRFGC